MVYRCAQTAPVRAQRKARATVVAAAEPMDRRAALVAFTAGKSERDARMIDSRLGSRQSSTALSILTRLGFFVSA
jgi:hypothetical protein